MKRLSIAVVVGWSILSALSTAQADITFNISSTGNASADAGFQAAAAYIQSQFDDDITININAGFSDLGPGILGSAGSSRANYTYLDFRTAVAGDVVSNDDLTFSTSIPQGNAFNVYINGTTEFSGNAYNDFDGGSNNRTVRLTHANAKALGLRSANNTAQDVNINFSNQFTWDFDPTNGITGGAIDFVGVAIHEIMHGMGFVSGVDTLDANANGNINDNAFTFVSSLDFLRHSADSLNANADIDWTADNRAKFYSIDGGLTSGSTLGGGVNHWSRGVNNGDGRQASHWRDNLGLGIMDPTSQPAGSANVVTALDLQALDVIGWDPILLAAIPEPSSFFMLAIGLGIFSQRRRV
ncbi:MAG: NF038122 family metalloprotease [Planctomycetota bacterium]